MKSYNIVSLIRKKREKEGLAPDEIRFLVQQYSRDVMPDYQMSAFLMACFLNGLNDEEAAALTREMLHSGTVMDLSSVPGVKVDKHSTGGVGDKTSLILAPIVAACGVPVPMISGRGLGHSGGTLDKLESIPGFNVNLDLDRYVEVLKKHGLVLIGQTEEIAPADKRMYALRDVTATVESIPLIAGSIMSKKLAEGIDALVLDVKFGSGAFMKTRDQALELARKLVSIGEEFGKRTIAYLTSMEQPLGQKVGNWFEVHESIECLNGGGPEDLLQVTHQLAGTMIYLGGNAGSVEEGIEKSRESVRNGTAMQKFRDIVTEQDGSTEYLDRPDDYPQARRQFDVNAASDGFITAMDAYAIGMAGVELGAGRKSKEDVVDPQSGIILEKKIGEDVRRGETIARCFTNKEEQTDMVRKMLQDAVSIGSSRVEVPALITDTVTKEGTTPWS
ncbi:thymidine phosphorylase [Natronogracilivirga saccharolytica]|uniref:thymidine phosphorylase n=1 Tax=Natronogracilivirga saccharolytica TaxID=2812953 RepID=A0A8J7RQG6_9BACT|nr:thymidine phosphorylase [Natronogracilivirga saccharolytica]MBP3191142.1 thymidine phosphorylase [Natronogracilivirga saccharolytica]